MTQHITKSEDREAMLNWLLGLLLSDGYLTQYQMRGTGRYRFRSNLLREFWLRRFVQ